MYLRLSFILNLVASAWYTYSTMDKGLVMYLQYIATLVDYKLYLYSFSGTHAHHEIPLHTNLSKSHDQPWDLYSSIALGSQLSKVPWSQEVVAPGDKMGDLVIWATML